MGQAPADLHPPLSKTKVAKVVVEVRTRASEAKGPFPGGKRVGSWGKKSKSKSKSKRKQKRKPLALGQKMHEDSSLLIRMILTIRIELTLALHL